MQVFSGVKFAELSSKQAYEFQKDLLLTLIRIEDVSGWTHLAWEGEREGKE